MVDGDTVEKDLTPNGFPKSLCRVRSLTRSLSAQCHAVLPIASPCLSAGQLTAVPQHWGLKPAWSSRLSIT